MGDAVMLFDGQVVPLSVITDYENFNPNDPDLLFFDDYEEELNGVIINRAGRVRRFKKNGISYMAIFNSISDRFVGYYSEKKFWENNYADNSKKQTIADYKLKLGMKFSYMPFLPIDSQMKVYFGYKFIDINEQNQNINLIYNYKFALYQEVNINSNINNLPIHANNDNEFEVIVLPVLSDLNYYVNYIINKKFLLPDNITLSSLDDSEKEILFEIIYVWNEIFKDGNFKIYLESKGLYSPFEAHLGMPNRYNIPFGDVDPKYHKLYNEEYFGILRLKLIEFRYWVLNYKENFNEIKESELAVYIINLFPYQELSFLEYELKINLLDKILKDNFWILGDWYFNYLNEEEALIKLVRSIYHETNGVPNYSDIDKFMIKLNQLYDNSINQTLYEVLYLKLNDSFVLDDDGNGNRGQFVKGVYQLWENSKFNPYHSNVIIANNALNNFIYTSYNCRWQANDPANYPFPLIDENAAPMVINYESDKTLLWYIDNFKFEFYKNKIVAKEDIENYGYQPYGVYNLFQPVSIKGSSANDTIIRMPILNMPANATNPNDYIKNCIPIFYLMYVDEVGDRSDAKETIGTAIDVVLTFTGVGGAVVNLRHLKNLSLIRKLGVGLSVAEKQLLWKGIAGLASVSEAFFGAASFFHSFLTGGCSVYYNSSSPPQEGSPQYLEYQRCQSIDRWLFALEILSLSGDLLARRQLRKASRELALTLTDDIPVEHRQVIDELADLDGLLDNFLNSIQSTHPNVYTKVNNFTSQDQKFAFMFDFERRISVLDELESSSHLIDEAWDDIHHLFAYRNSIAFLKSYHFIGKDPRCLRLREHLFEGHIYLSGNSGGWHHIEGATNINNYGRIDNLISLPDLDGYYIAHVSIKNNLGVWIPKTDNAGLLIENDMFPRKWNRQEVIENIAVAYTTKVYNGVGNQYRGIMSDGRILIICINGNTNIIDHTTNIKTVWPKH